MASFTYKFHRIILGLKDYSPWLAMHTVLDFWKAIGPEKIRKYIHGLAQQASMIKAPYMYQLFEHDWSRALP